MTESSTAIQFVFDFNDPAVKAAIQKIVLETLAQEKRSSSAKMLPQKAKEEKEESNSYPGSDETINRPVMDPVFTRFLATGDVSEIRDIPDHKKIFKNYIFCTLTELRGRTILVEKAATRGKISMGLMPAQYWDDEVLAGLETTLKEAPQRAVIFTDGSRPFVISDIAFVDNKEWEIMGRLFNSLYSKF